MPGESLSFDITADDRASSKFRDVGNSALGASAKIDLAAASLKLWDDTNVKSQRGTDNLIRSQTASAKAFNTLARAESFVSSESGKAQRTMAVLKGEVEDTGQKADNAAKSFGGLAGAGGGGGLAGGGMGALYGAGVALAPVIATVGTGLLGLGAAAYGIAKPIEKAAQATGGLQANMAKLNPEQQAVAQGILNLGQNFAAFQHQLEPTVLGLFNRGLRLASVLLADIEPVSAAAGKALQGTFSQIAAVFQGGTWQGFFTFMRRTAAVDVQLLTANFTSLLQALPPLVEQLQPVAESLLTITSVVIKLAGYLARFSQSTQATTQHMNFMEKATALLRTVLFAPGAGLLAALKLLHIYGTGAGKGIADGGQAAAVAGPKFFSFSKTVAALNTSMTKLVGNLLTLQGSELGWKQALQSAQAQLKSNTAGLEGNSKNALANKQAVLQSTNAAITFASQQLTLGRNIGQASRTVQDQINWLQKLHDKSSFVRQEIAALRAEEAKLAAARINQTINVQGLGQWSVSQSLAPGHGHRIAAGGLIPGSGNTDSYPALLMPGEVVVPKGMVASGAVDHLRGSLPGFASGGIVPGFKGQVGGIWPWVHGNDQATVRLIDLAVVKATVAGIKAAEAAAAAAARAASGGGAHGGPTSASAAQAQAYARSRLGAYGWGGGEMGPLISLWDRESGWNRFARNPSSGAYGIPQALPPGKMGAAANPPTSSAAAQINWGLGYIKGRYGSPSGAWGHEVSFGWYDRGGMLPPGLSLAYNATGRPEQVIPNRGGGAQEIVLRIEGGGNEAVLTTAILQILRKAVRTHHGGSVQAALGRP